MPTITALKFADRKGQRTLVELDGKAWAEIASEAVLRHALRKGDHLSAEQTEALLADHAFIQARRAAAILLHTRPRSEAELRLRLLEKKFAPEIIERTLRHLAETGDLDDARFARLYARNQLKTRRIGPAKVRHQLRRLGVPEAAIADALADEPAAQADRQLEQAVLFLERRLKNTAAGAFSPAQRPKMRAALLRAGFDPAVCKEALSRFSGADMPEQPDARLPTGG